MFPHISSLNTSSPFHGLTLIHRRASSCALTCKCIKDTPFNNGSSDRPLIVFHSFVPVDPLSVGPVKFDFLPPPKSFSSVPFSLRFVQLRKKRSNLPLPKTPPPNLCALGASVLSLASIIAETQKLFFPNNSSSDVSSCTDSGYSFIWLFHKVFASSPALTVGILSLMGQFVNVAINREIGWVVADLEWKKIVQAKKAEEEKKFESWSEIGINMEEQESVVEADIIAMSDRKQITYERLIICNEGTSLILSNYAQYLYQIQKDYDRAEEYFERAVEAEPVDAEAMSRYAVFLWRQKGDLEKAEEMFVKSVDIEPTNNHYLCAYTHFLWMTGGTEICVEEPQSKER